MNHLLNVTTQALDVGATTPMLWMFEEREKINYDHPFAFDNELLMDHIKTLKKGKKVEIFATAVDDLQKI